MSNSAPCVGHGSPYAWLWQNLEFADVALEIVFSTPQVTNSESSACISHNQQSMDGAGNSLCHLKQICGAAGEADSAEVPLPVVSTLGQETTSSQPLDSVLKVRLRSEDVKSPQHLGTLEPGTAIISSSELGVEQLATSTSTTRRYLLHSQVISSNSAFLRASLTTAVGTTKRKRGTDDVCRWQICLEMAAEDADAVEAVMQCFYKQQLDDTTPGADLLSIMKVADHWQAPGVADTASKVLCQRKESFPIAHVYTLPDTLKASSFFQDVMAAAEVSLLAMFGDTLVVIRSKPLLMQFLALPQPALLALIQSDDLLTDAEETILLLVSSWCEGVVGKACTVEQEQELNDSIRYGCLSRPYLTDLCDCYMPRCAKLTREQLMELWVFTPSADEDRWRLFESVNSADWYLPGRGESVHHHSSVKLKLVVTEEQLHTLLACLEDEVDDSVQSESVYAHGFLWRLALQVKEGGLCCDIIASGVSDIHDLTGEGKPLKHGVRCVSSIHIDAPQPHQIFKSDCMLVTTRGIGAEMTGPRGDFREAGGFEWWAGFVEGGSVSFTAKARPTAPD